MKDMWEQRYAAEEYAYGEGTNALFKAGLDQLEHSRNKRPLEFRPPRDITLSTTHLNLYDEPDGRGKLVALLVASDATVSAAFALATTFGHRASTGH